jgi:sugar phosphate permease
VGTAEGHLGGLVIASGIGYACAAFITPPVTRRLSKPAWITVLLLASAVVTVALGETFNELAYLAIGFGLYLTRQGVAICSVTILQEEVADEYRGRVFAFYDMMSNATYVAGAALSAAFMPANGHSPAIVGVVAAGYAVLAGGYWLARPRRQSPSGSDPGGSGPDSGPDGASAGAVPGSGVSGTGMPSSAAQRSSS